MCAYLHLCVENVEGRVGWEGQDPHQLVLGGSILDLYLIKQVPVEEITMLATGQELANMNKKKNIGELSLKETVYWFFFTPICLGP